MVKSGSIDLFWFTKDTSSQNEAREVVTDHSLQYDTKDDMSSIEPRGLGRCDEEL